MQQPTAPLPDLLRRAVLSIAITSAVLLALLVGGPFAITIGACVTPGLDRFDPTLWRLGDHDLPCGTRSRMAEDLVSHRLSVGMRKQQVTELLGEPASPSDSVWGGEDALVYMTGCFIDCNWVIMQFDQGGRLLKAFTYQD